MDITTLACRWYGTTFASLQAMEASGLRTNHTTRAHHALGCGLVVQEIAYAQLRETGHACRAGW